MVFIESVELENFKSFHGYRNIGPFSTTNAIVGANGAGKSNIVDAITFAFGDSAKNLRAQKIADLIYCDSVKKIKESSCFVQLKITLPNSEKIVLLKRIVKSAGGEEFYINDVKHSKSEYVETIEGYGIFVRNENFVLRQDAIGKMTEKADNYRAEFIGAVSGSAKYADECKKLQKEYDDVQKKLQNHQEVCKTTNQEKQKLFNANDKRKDIQADVERLKDLKVIYYLSRLYPLEKSLEEIDKTFIKKKAKLESEKTEDTEKILDLETTKKHELTAILTRAKKAKSNQAKFERDDETLKRDFDEFRQKMTVEEKKMESTSKVLRTLEDKSQQNKKDVAALEEKLKSLELELANVEKEIFSSQEGISSQDLQEFKKLQQDFENSKPFTDVLDIESRLKSAQLKLSSLKEAVMLEQERLQKKEQELASLMVDNTENERARAIQEQIHNLSNEMAKIKENEDKNKKYSKELEEITLQLGAQVHQNEKDRKDAQRKKLESDFISSFGTKVSGVLKHLCTPVSDDYILAGTRVFKKWQNAFVVDSEEVAMACIEFLKEHKMPRQKFLPVNALRVHQLTPEVEAAVNTGRAKLIRDCFKETKTSPAISKALDFVCGTILVCDDAQTADEIAFNNGRRLTTVAKDGTFFNKNGRVTGGKTELQRSGNIFSQEDKLKQRRDELLKLLKEFPSQNMLYYENERRINELKMQLQKFKQNQGSHLQEKEKQREILRRQIDEIQATFDGKKAAENVAETAVEELEQQRRQLQEKKDELEQNIFGPYCEQHNITDFEAFKSQSLDTFNRSDSRKQELRIQIERLKAEIAFVQRPKLNDYDENLKKYENLQGIVEKMRAEIEEKRKVCDQKHAEYLKAHEENELVSKELDEATNDYENIKARAKKAKAIVSKLEHLRREKDNKIEMVLTKISSLFFECRVKDVLLPLKDGSFEDVELFEGDSAETTFRSATSSGVIKLHDIKADYSVLEPHMDDVSNEKRNLAFLEKKMGEISELEKQIAMKEAGVSSSADYSDRIAKIRETEKVNIEKFNELSKELQMKKRNLETVKSKRKELFLKTFQQMQRDVDYYYKLIYDDNFAQAILTLVGNDDEPYNSKVDFKLIVPGKQQASIDRLSGGEKSIACLALLFAGRSKTVNCILMDEFDAALDKNNLNLVAQFCIDMSLRGTQFILVSHLYESFTYCQSLIGGYLHCPASCNFGTCTTILDTRDITHQLQDVPDYEQEVSKRRRIKTIFKTNIDIPLCQPKDEDELEEFWGEFMAAKDVAKFIEEKKKIDESLGLKCANDPLNELQEAFDRFYLE